MNDHTPQFTALSQIEEKALTAKLDVVRNAISHAGEKGRALEGEVISLVRSFLPMEYGLSTGFIVHHTDEGPKLSKQLDVIIYDAIRSGPIVRLGSCEIFPLEAVYGYIEVKASLQSTSDKAGHYAENSIETCILHNKILRSMKRAKYSRPQEGSPNEIEIIDYKDRMPIRSYIFAFEASGAVANDPHQFAKRMSEFSRKSDPVHLHGVFVGESAYYKTRAVDPKIAKPEDYYHIKYTQDHILAAFKWSLLHGLSRFPRHPNNWTPLLDEYNESKSQWSKVSAYKGT